MQKILSLLTTALLLSGLAFYSQNEESHSFKTWQKKYNKFYSSSEEAYRQIIFNQNVELINKHNSNPNKSYSMAINQFVDLTREEFQAIYLGKSTIVKTENIELSARKNFEAVDWSSKLFPIKDQFNCGSYWIFSAVGAVEAFLRVKKVLKWSLSEQQLVDCADSWGCYGGDADFALDYIVNTGIVYELDYPYKGREGFCKVRREGEVKISGRERIGSNEDDIKQKVQEYPVSASVDCQGWAYYSKGIFDEGCTDHRSNHDVVIVGFDKDGNWKIRNSWGVGWGEQGYMWLKSGNTCGIMNRVDRAI
ncbi:unnamed protein product (macronuclear) [Paramecium tetraurelia]|uniref:cathepsin L n=1 Tax=Paramecium tetraurelia TaxID=5888 RepID=A0CM86_PARTE|nr:uncharacterized protein GSPATT00008382001 [Paramecium tetraurelia]CAK71903.1 unnamed protein product [Paramecium tetraurelia]|eukprot:XP_001439300.1 hypothetical protein (macronuclear) [Paramecium tetraurelia strain d4-2]